MLTSREMSRFLASGPWPLDGGLATTLESHGVDISGALWSARALVEQPQSVQRAHESFVDAGAAVIITASYQVSRSGFVSSGLTAAAADTALRRSVEVARDAVDTTRTYVAASVGPYGATLHDGSEYRGDHGVSRRFLRDFHAQRLAVLVDADPDFIAVETIPDVHEVVAVVEALGDVPAWISISCADDERTCAGQPIEDAVLAASTGSSVFAVGVNCSAPRNVTGLIQRIRAVTALPIVVYPNAGREWIDGTWSGDITGVSPHDVGEWLAAGAAAVGGCCETTANDVALIAHLCATRRSD